MSLANARAFLTAGDAEPEVTKPIAARVTARATKRLWTTMTEDELSARNLRVVRDATVAEIARPPSGWSMPTSHAVEWLVPEPEAQESRELPWRAALESRIAELRDIAAEEGLPFCNASAAAALAFVDDLPSAAQPGTFLVGGNVRLLWRTADGEQVGLQFRGAEKIQFVNLERDGKDLEPMMGTGSHAKVRVLLNTLAARRILLNG